MFSAVSRRDDVPSDDICSGILNRVPLHVPQVLVVEDGKIRQYNGDFEDYRAELTKEIQQELDEE